MQLVYQHQQIALMGLGKINNPITNKSEKSLEQAKFAIYTLDMTSEKTKGNLNERENKFIQDVVRELKLNYITEISK